MRVPRTVVRTLALGASTFLLTGCLKLTMDLDVTSENTVDGTAVFAIDRDVLELGGGTVEDVLGDDAIVPPDVEGVTVEPYEDDEFAGQEITFDGVRLDEFNQDGAEGSLTIVREGDVFRVSGLLDLSMDETDTEGMPFDTQEMFGSAEVRITLSFPGEVESSNGEVDGNTVTWSPQVGERAELNAVASAIGGGGGSSALWIVLAVVALGAIAAVALVSSRRRTAGPEGAGPVGAGPVGAGPVGAGPEPTEAVPPPASPETQPEPPAPTDHSEPPSTDRSEPPSPPPPPV